jgi:endoglucanase
LARTRSFFATISLLVPLTSVLTVGGCNVFFPSSGDPPPPPPPPPMGGWMIHPVRADSVGYLVDRAKRVTIVLPEGMSALPEAAAEVRDAASGAVVSTCTVEGPMTDPATGATYYVGDFTPFNAPGSYYVAVPSLPTATGIAMSATFPIGPAVFRPVITRSMLGMYGQRCGIAVTINLDGQTWSHGVCHQKDASQKYLNNVMTDTIKPSLRGWHDAGDYGKYTTNGAFAAGMMLMAFEHFQPTLSALTLPIPEEGGALPDFLDEVKWQLDWLLTTQGADGSVAFKVTALNFEGVLMPEEDGSNRYYTPISTSAGANFAAVMAQASRIYRPYDAALADTYLAAARSAYTFVKSSAATIRPDLTLFSTGGYDGGSGDGDNRLWAAAELWETTGEATFLTDFETAPVPRTVADNFDWDNVANLGIFTYLLSERPGRDQAVLDATTASAIASATAIATRADAAPFGRAINGYWWGSNGSVARTAMNLWVGSVLSPTDAGRFADAIAMQLDHLLGRNIYDRTQVTGVGYHPPARPHHRPSQADRSSLAWPGLLVGGANPSADTSKPPGATWLDDADAYDLNEVAINWNGALIYAAAALTPPQ